MSANVSKGLSGTGVIIKMGDGANATVTLTAAALAAATSLTVAALPIALNAGTTLDFGGGVIATVSAAAVAGATSVSVQALSGALANGAQATGVENFATVAEVTDVTPPAPSTNTFEITHHLSSYKEFGVGMTDPGTAQFTVNWIPSDPTQDATTGFQKALDDKRLRRWKVIYPFTPVRVHNFRGLVTSITYAAPIDNRMTAQVTIQISGKPTLDAA